MLTLRGFKEEYNMHRLTQDDKKRRYYCGFTLIEMLTVFVVIGILAAIAIPSFSVWLPKYRLKRAVNDLHANLQLAKLTAIKENRTCSVSYSTSPDQYTVSIINKTVNLDHYGSPGEIRFCNNPQTGGAPPPHPTINFNSRGIISSGVTAAVTAKYAYLTNNKNSAYFRVGATTAGVVRTNRWSGSNWE